MFSQVFSLQTGGTTSPRAVIISGVLHTAGVLSDALFLSQTAHTARQVAGPKLATWLGLAARELSQHPVTHAVAFSSVAAAFGSAGQVGG